jgi:hypothetical protein
MTRKNFLKIVVLLLPILGVVGFFIGVPQIATFVQSIINPYEATVRFRVVATVEIDGQPHEGSTVMEITYRRVSNSPIGVGGKTTLKGEALILDLKGRGTIFIIPHGHSMKSPGSIYQVYEQGVLNALGAKGSVGTVSDEDFRKIRDARGRYNFGRGGPALVSFRDEKDPKSIFQIDPDKVGDAYPGVNFKGLRIEITRDRVTRALAERLTWLSTKEWTPTTRFPRDPPGSRRSDSERPIGFKINEDYFFGTEGRQ